MVPRWPLDAHLADDVRCLPPPHTTPHPTPPHPRPLLVSPPLPTTPHASLRHAATHWVPHHAPRTAPHLRVLSVAGHLLPWRLPLRHGEGRVPRRVRRDLPRSPPRSPPQGTPRRGRQPSVRHTHPWSRDPWHRRARVRACSRRATQPLGGAAQVWRGAAPLRDGGHYLTRARRSPRPCPVAYARARTAGHAERARPPPPNALPARPPPPHALPARPPTPARPPRRLTPWGGDACGGSWAAVRS